MQSSRSLCGSGPGLSFDQAYYDGIAALRLAGVATLGFVATSDSGRPLAGVKAEVDTWIRWYPDLTGIVFTEMSVDNVAAHIQYVNSATAYVKQTVGLSLAWVGNDPTINSFLAKQIECGSSDRLTGLEGLALRVGSSVERKNARGITYIPGYAPNACPRAWI